jgi:crossover junction endodeoxyribonuclease RuvC
VIIFGIDPGSTRTGYGCVETDGRRHRLVACGALSAPATTSFPDKLLCIHAGLVTLLAKHRPDCVVIENIFHAKNARSALRLGEARGVALLAAAATGLPIAEYTPAEIKRAVVGFGRAEKQQIGQMVKLLLGLDVIPSPHDAADAIAVAICHIHGSTGPVAQAARALPTRGRAAGGTVRRSAGAGATSWRDYRP